MSISFTVIPSFIALLIERFAIVETVFNSVSSVRVSSSSLEYMQREAKVGFVNKSSLSGLYPSEVNILSVSIDSLVVSTYSISL